MTGTWRWLRGRMKKRRFLIGLLLRLALLVSIRPMIQENWFADFVIYWLRNPTIDPWAGYLAAGGPQQAFPYGIVMLLVHAVPVAAGALLDSAFASGRIFALIGFGVSILLADLCLYGVLVKWLGEDQRELVDRFYWLSPLVVYVNYIHGQTDIVPTALLFASLLLLASKRPFASGVALALSVSAKLSMALIVPFFLVHLFALNRRMAASRAPFVAGLCVAGVVVLVALLPGGRRMILGNQELIGVLQSGLRIGDSREFLLLPFAYLLLVYFGWTLSPLDKRSLAGFVSLVFIVVLLSTQAPIGWFLWLVPAVLPYAAKASRPGRWLLRALAVTAVAYSVSVDSGFRFSGGSVDVMRTVANDLLTQMPIDIRPLLATTVACLLIVIGFRVYHHAMTANWLFALTRWPIMIGIAGDSGVGKDTLTQSVVDAFGPNRVAQLLGDDYHRYPRQGRLWRVMTHLNPRANDLAAMARDAMVLARGGTCNVAHYDHDTGLFTQRRRIRSSDIIVVNGLHALYPPSLNRLYNLRVYLDMDEDLRTYFKVRRDSVKRGATAAQIRASMARRAPDAARFLKPQRHVADIVFTVEPVAAIGAGEPTANGLSVRIETRLDIDIERFARELSAIAAVPSTVEEDFGIRRLIVHDGFANKDDAKACFVQLMAHAEEFVAPDPVWHSGTVGVMQLFVVYALTASKLHHDARAGLHERPLPEAATT